MSVSGFVFSGLSLLRDRFTIALFVLVLLIGIAFGFSASANTLPFGHFDGVTEDTLWGWVYDPDSGSVPTEVHVYIDGVPTISLRADQPRHDLVAAGVAPEATHGFSWQGFSLDPGTHTLEVFAINDPPGHNPSLGTRTLVVGGVAPVVDSSDDGAIERLPEAEDIVTFETNLVGLWHFDEEVWRRTTDEIRDASGTGNHGMARNGITTVAAGRVNRGAEFDGKDDVVTMGDAAALNNDGTQPMTVSAWVKIPQGSTNKVILSKYDTTSGRNVGYQLWHDKPSRLQFDIGTTLTNRVQVRGSTSIADGGWHHVVATYDGSQDASGVKLYVDGQLETMTIDHNRLSERIATNAPFNVGARNNGDDRIKGSIDEVAMWQRVLSEEEISDLYQRLTFEVETSQESGVMAFVFKAFASLMRLFSRFL